MKTLNRPYLSFVTWTRNDEYAPDMLLRQQTSWDILIEQLERFGIDSEIIIVEWNPPPEKLPLKDVLRFPRSSPRVSARIVVVDPRYHQGYEYADIRPMHGAVACNVGLRRARGRFCLIKSADVFYSEPLMTWLAEKSQSEESVYRCTRYDVDPVVLEPGDTGPESFLKSCERNVLSRYGTFGRYPRCPQIYLGAEGDFLLMSREYWHAIRGWHETPDVLCTAVDTISLHAAIGAGAKQVVLDDACRVYKITHGSTHSAGRTPVYGPFSKQFVFLKEILGEDTKRWISLLFNFPKERIKGFEGILFDSVSRIVVKKSAKWTKGIGPFYLNDQDWGLGGEDLPEEIMCTAQWEE